MTKFFVLRHAESTSNSGENDCKDPHLTLKGIEQCKNVKGCYDLTIVSPLRRTQETLKYSSVTYKDIVTSDLCRERIFHIRDLKIIEQDSIQPENDSDYNNRVYQFKQYLHDIKCSNQYETVLIVTHAYFCASLGAYGIKNAEILEIYL
jgi:broad specificity phosphatase PhoE